MAYEALQERLSISNSPAEDTCRACGACCLGSALISLSRKEASRLRSAGTLLNQVTHYEGREDYYSMDSPCGFLDIAEDGLYSCQLYGQPERPRACLKTVSEGPNCDAMREDAVSFLVALENNEPLDLGFDMLAA